MPKAQSTDARVNEFRRMDGTTFATRVGGDLLLLQPEEQERALRVLGALREAVARETQAATR